MSGLQLSELTHEEGPWLKVRGSIHSGASSSQEIPVDEIRKYFRELDKLDDLTGPRHQPLHRTSSSTRMGLFIFEPAAQAAMLRSL